MPLQAQGSFTPFAMFGYGGITLRVGGRVDAGSTMICNCKCSDNLPLIVVTIRSGLVMRKSCRMIWAVENTSKSFASRGIYASVYVHSCYLWMFLQILHLSNASSEQEGVYLLKLKLSKLMYHKRLHSPDQDTIWFHHLNMCHEFYTKLQVVAALYHLPWLGGHHVSRKSLDAVGMPAQRERTGGLLRFILVTIMLSPLFCVSILKPPKFYETLLTKNGYQTV